MNPKKEDISARGNLGSAPRRKAAIIGSLAIAIIMVLLAIPVSEADDPPPGGSDETFIWHQNNLIYELASTIETPWKNTVALSSTGTLSYQGDMNSPDAMLVDSNDNIHIFRYDSGTGKYYDYLYTPGFGPAGFTETLLFTEAGGDYPWGNIVSIDENGLSTPPSLGIDKNYILIDRAGDLHLLYHDTDRGGPQDAFMHRTFTSSSWSDAREIYDSDTGEDRPWNNIKVLKENREISGSLTAGPGMLVDVFNNIHIFRPTVSGTTYSYETYTWDPPVHWASTTLVEYVSVTDPADPPWQHTRSIAETGLSPSSFVSDKNGILIDTSGVLHVLYWYDKTTPTGFRHITYDGEWGTARTILYSLSSTNRPWTKTVVLTKNRELSGSMVGSSRGMLVDVFNNIHVFYSSKSGTDCWSYYAITWDPLHGNYWAYATLVQYASGTGDPADWPWQYTVSIAETGLYGIHMSKNMILIDTSSVLHVLYWEDTTYPTGPAGFEHIAYDGGWGTDRHIYDAGQLISRPWSHLRVLKENREIDAPPNPCTGPCMFVDVFNNIHIFNTIITGGDTYSYKTYTWDTSTVPPTYWTSKLLVEYVSATDPADPPWRYIASIAETGLSPAPPGSFGDNKNGILIDTSGVLHVLYWEDDTTPTAGFEHITYDGGWGTDRDIYTATSTETRPWKWTWVLKENREKSGYLSGDAGMLVDVFNNIHIFNTIITGGDTYSYKTYTWDTSTVPPTYWTSKLLVEYVSATDPADPPWLYAASIAETGLSGSLSYFKNGILIDTSGVLHVLYWEDDTTPTAGFEHITYDGGWGTDRDIYTATSTEARPWGRYKVLKENRELDGQLTADAGMLVDVFNNIHIFMTTESGNIYSYKTYTWDPPFKYWNGALLFDYDDPSADPADPPWQHTRSIAETGLSPSAFVSDKNGILIDASGNVHVLYWEDDTPTCFRHRMYKVGWALEGPYSIYPAIGTDTRPWTNTKVLKENRELSGTLTADAGMLVDVFNNIHIFRPMVSGGNTYSYYTYTWDPPFHRWLSKLLLDLVDPSADPADPPWEHTRSIAETGLSPSSAPLPSGENMILIDTSGVLHVLYWEDDTTPTAGFEHMTYDDIWGWGTDRDIYSATGEETRPWANTKVLKENRELSGTLTADAGMLVDVFNNIHIFRPMVSGGNTYSYYTYMWDPPTQYWRSKLLLDLVDPSADPADPPWQHTRSIAETGLSPSAFASGKNGILIDASGDLHVLYWEDGDQKFKHTGYIDGGAWSIVKSILSGSSTATRPWENTLVLEDDGTVSGSTGGVSPAMVVDELEGILNGGKADNIHFFWHDASTHDWNDLTYTWYDTLRRWNDVEVLFNAIGSATRGTPWQFTVSIADSGLTGLFGQEDPLGHNAILIDRTGRPNLLYYQGDGEPPFKDDSFNHRVFNRIIIS